MLPGVVLARKNGNVDGWAKRQFMSKNELWEWRG